jgi:hypothetical protein
MTPFDAYRMFTAVKLHFSSDSYDFFKYHGKVRVDETKFETRRDKYHYYKLTKRVDPLLLTVVNLFRNSNIWIGDLFTTENEKWYRDRKAVIQSIDYTVKSQMEEYDSLNDALNVRGGDYPALLEGYRLNRVSPETLIIVNRINNGKVFDYWSDTISDPVVWPDLCHRLLKYEPFLVSDILNKERWLTLFH